MHRLLLLTALALPQQPTTPTVEPVVITDRVERFGVDREALRRFYGISLSDVRRERLERFLADWTERLAQLDYERLDARARTDYQLLRTEVRADAAQLMREQARYAEVAACIPFAGELLALEEARWRTEGVDPPSAAALLARVRMDVEALTKRVVGDEPALIDSTAEEDADAPAPIVLDPVRARRAARAVDSVLGALADWFRNHEAYDPVFAWWAREPYERLRKSLGEYATHLRADVAGLKGEDDDPLVGEPIGRAALLEELAREWIAYTPEELIEAAEREFAWCDAELERAATELGVDLAAALERVKQDYVAPGEQDEYVAQQAREAIAWLDARQLVTIEDLCRETWRVEMLSRETQRVLPFAAYGGQEVLVAYPTHDMEQTTKTMSLRGNNRAFTRNVTPHELIPGHHLQGYMARRYATHRREFRTPFLTEGWALYWEMLMYDEGYARTPEERIGFVFWRRHRCARVVLSLRYHLGEIDPDEMIDELVERVGHERFTATSEVRRYIGDGYGPLYQCAYLIGGLQLRALARECIDAGWTAREFHDAVLHRGPIPVELLRAELTQKPLARDAEPAWRFLDR